MKTKTLPVLRSTMPVFCAGQVRRKGKRFVPCAKRPTTSVNGVAYCHWHAQAITGPKI